MRNPFRRNILKRASDIFGNVRSQFEDAKQEMVEKRDSAIKRREKLNNLINRYEGNITKFSSIIEKFNKIDIAQTELFAEAALSVDAQNTVALKTGTDKG